MSVPYRIVPALWFLLVTLLTTPAVALEECRLLRQPDIAGDRIVFVYAGDLWTVARGGGVAARLTTHDGVEQFPKLSPDGKTVAFTAEYDGNVDAYTVPVDGGEPTRLTWNPAADQVAEWYPDGKSVLVRSARESVPRRFTQFFKVAATGGFEEKLSLPMGGYASWSSDGTKLAYVTPTYDSRTWKRYKGGNAPNIWIYDFKQNLSSAITDWEGADEWPMWFESRVYYASDEGGRTANIWCYDTATRQRRQVTTFTEYDVKWPSIGGDALVFENGGQIYVMSLPDEKATPIRVLVPDDKPATRASLRNVAKWTTGFDLSPGAKRALLEARGDIFTVPAEHGDVRNLTQSPGARERDPAWSPDGKSVAYLSDRTGEYEIWVRPADGSGTERQVTKGGTPTFRYAPRWSPDSKKLAFTDKTWTLWWVDASGGEPVRVDQAPTGDIDGVSWSPDSRWLAYARPGDNSMRHICLYSMTDRKVTAVTSDMTEDFSPAFDPRGRWLYFVSRRTFNPGYGQFEFDYHFTATDKIYALSLVDTTGRPTPPRSDEEGKGGDEKGKDDGKDKDKDKKDAKGDDAAKNTRIDLAGLGSRAAELPIEAGRIGGITAYDDHILYLAVPGEISADDGPPKCSIHTFSLEDQEDKTVIAGVRPSYGSSKDGKKVIYRTDDGFGIVGIDKENKPGDGKIAADPLMATVDPKLEWKQMFNEAWRLERDFYYDPKMGGLDWNQIGDRYRKLVPYAAHRADMNYILGELIGELSTSHTYVGGGDYPDVRRTPGGLLGVDWELDKGSGRYRFARILRDRDWNSNVEAPLGVPGVLVKEGDYLISVNGHDVKAPENVFAAFEGTADHMTTLTVSSSPDGARRTYIVTPVKDDYTIRMNAWIASNREKVSKATNGRVAYIYVPNTATAGVQEFAKQYYPQVEKEGIIVDERYNGGGFIPDFFVERLERTTWTYWSSRDGKDFRTPSAALDGPKCILINEYAGSGGDAFPYYFRLRKLGPVIGKRTWGGLVGIGHDLPLVDGGSVTMPDFGMWDAGGKWTIENHGVDPDIEVENAPHLVARGQDPQLERAIQYVNEELKKNPPVRPKRPAYKVQPGLSGR